MWLKRHFDAASPDRRDPVTLFMLVRLSRSVPSIDREFSALTKGFDDQCDEAPHCHSYEEFGASDLKARWLYRGAHRDGRPQDSRHYFGIT